MYQDKCAIIKTFCYKKMFFNFKEPNEDYPEHLPDE